MWIFTPEGMLSCTEYPKDSDYIQVRARSKIQLLAFISKVDDDNNFGSEDVIDNPKKDYQYRVIVQRDLFAEWMLKYAERINYTNFKTEATRFNGYGEYVKMLGRIWEDGMDTIGENKYEYWGIT
jgi:hypothetical protein